MSDHQYTELEFDAVPTEQPASKYLAFLKFLSWFVPYYRKFKITFRHKQGYKVKECFAFPQTESDNVIVCILLVLLEPRTGVSEIESEFYVEFACSPSTEEVKFSLAVQIKEQRFAVT